MKKILPILVIVLLIAGFGLAWKLIEKDKPLLVTNFEKCAAAGNPVMEFYPRQCRHGDQTFTEVIGNELEKADLIRIDSPRPNQVISSPLTITGHARGSWFFEASFPVVLTNWDGVVIAQGIATATSDWMTVDFVPFEAKLTFTGDQNASNNNGTLILRKANPSGLPEHDDALELPVVLGEATGQPTVCTQDAKLCPDGSYVSRTGPNCVFTPCPAIQPQPITECTKDSDCPSSQYICQEIQGTGSACPSTDPSCVPTHTITQGECKLKEGNRCGLDAHCASGNLCYKNICTSPVGSTCSGPSDTSCPADFECVPGCGAPVEQYPDDTPPSYFCQLKGYIRNCPICLAQNTLIDTPLGEIAVQDMQPGMFVWTVSTSGKRTRGIVAQVSKTPVPLDHKMVRLMLDGGHTLFVSPGHPTIDGRTVGDLAAGNLYNGVRVMAANRVAYGEGYTYDILPSGETGFYFANGILLGSTLQPHATPSATSEVVKKIVDALGLSFGDLLE